MDGLNGWSGALSVPMVSAPSYQQDAWDFAARHLWGTHEEDKNVEDKSEDNKSKGGYNNGGGTETDKDSSSGSGDDLEIDISVRWEYIEFCGERQWVKAIHISRTQPVAGATNVDEKAKEMWDPSQWQRIPKRPSLMIKG